MMTKGRLGVWTARCALYCDSFVALLQRRGASGRGEIFLLQDALPHCILLQKIRILDLTTSLSMFYGVSTGHAPVQSERTFKHILRNCARTHLAG